MEKARGRDEITLLPRYDFIQRTTPKVIRYNEMKRRRCCHRKDAILPLETADDTYAITVIIFLQN
jgi:hypothetical protein